MAALAGGAAALWLGGAGTARAGWPSDLLDEEEALDKRVQPAVTGRTALAPEYPPAQISKVFKSNGTHDPQDAEYQALARNGFADWRLAIGGLVEHPASLSLAELRSLPARSQITRQDCVEGWSCIGKWTGARLGPLLDRVKPKPAAGFAVFFCADPMENTLAGAVKYYESIGLADAYHPQTILAYDMNDAPLPVPYGAPLRLRVERQLGYKMAKYLMRIELVDSFAGIGEGRGGYWEDRGYEWYAGI